MTFSRFRADVAAAAGRLRGTGQAVLACDDTYAFAVGWFALLHVGADIVLPPNGQSGTLAAFADRSILVVDDTVLSITPAPNARFQMLDLNRRRIIFHTSGSTGTPKRITRTLGMLQRESETLQRVWGDCAGTEPVRATVSHQHLYGLAFRLLWPLSAGRPFDATTDAVWETLLPKLGNGAMLISSPAHLGRLVGIHPVASDRRPSLVFSAGAPLSRDAAVMCDAILGCRPTEIFGSTETGAMAARRPNDGDEPWKLLPDTAIRCDNDGRMAVCSPYGRREWQQTEDVVEPAADGFRFIGRADRIVKIEGKRVSLPEVEAALEALPLVAAAAVVLLPGLPARLGGLLVLTQEGRARLDQLGGFRFARLLRGDLARTFDPAGLPRSWRFADALPMQAMGKRASAEIVALFGHASP